MGSTAASSGEREGAPSASSGDRQGAPPVSRVLSRRIAEKRATDAAVDTEIDEEERLYEEVLRSSDNAIRWGRYTDLADSQDSV